MFGKKREAVDAVAELDQVAGARGGFAEAEGRAPKRGARPFLLAIGFVVIIAAVSLVRLGGSEDSEDSTPTESTSASQEPFKLPAFTPRLPPAVEEPIVAPMPPQEETKVTTDTAEPAGPTPEELAQQALIQRRLASGMKGEAAAAGGGSSNGLESSAGQSASGRPQGALQLLGADSVDGQAMDMRARLAPMGMQSTRADRIRSARLKVLAGTPMECVLNDRIVSTLPASIACTITRDIWSADRTVVLIDRGSVVHGYYETSIRQGQGRVFIVWDLLVTPDFVRISLQSPGTGPLGEGGVAGFVDNHFAQRLGGALLLSIVDDALSAATDRRNQSDTQINLESSTSTSKDLAATVLENSINIPPTIYINQGERISIRVIRDLDFGEVYDIRRR